MDFDFMALYSSRNLSSVQAAPLHSDNYSSFDDSEDGDDDLRALFPCPFCYVHIEIPMLCSHLKEEHCFDLKHAVCPLCAANLGKDATGHFVTQHSSSVKRRRKFEKRSFFAGSSMVGKRPPTDLRGNKHDQMPDPLLSPFICSSPFSKSNSIQTDDCSSNDLSVVSDTKSSSADEQDSDIEENHQERKQRVAFVQDLFTSTIFIGTVVLRIQKNSAAPIINQHR